MAALSLLAASAALATPLVLAGHPSVRPWPIGPGPGYRPPATSPAVATGKPVGTFRCGGGPTVSLHLEIFADRRAIVIPAGIGVAPPLRLRSGVVVATRCTYPVSTSTPTGVVQLRRGVALRLIDLFRIWGQTLAPGQIASFRSRLPVRAYLDGRRVRGPVAAIPLRRHEEIVLELGAYVAPHPFFLFAGPGS
jgi:hypothetical protein